MLFNKSPNEVIFKKKFSEKSVEIVFLWCESFYLILKANKK